nr:hypothetical protein I302_01053 [Kwoniella bestiolae CBS 10118]OCF29545.1 hypothetical protein I302_01053 [Kwoniella bestiolae CBS 10118]
MFPSRDFSLKSNRIRQVYLAEEEIQGRYVPTKTFDPSCIKRKEADEVDSLEEDEDEDDDLILQLSDFKRSPQVKEL